MQSVYDGMYVCTRLFAVYLRFSLSLFPFPATQEINCQDSFKAAHSRRLSIHERIE